MLGKKIGIDLGTTAVRVHVRGEGIVHGEPSAVAVDPRRGAERIVGVGEGAQQAAASRTGVEIRRALDGGAISDRSAAEALVAGAITRVCGRQRIFRPDVMVSVSAALGGTDRRFLLEVCARAGARTMYLIDAPLAAGIGAGAAVGMATGRLVLDAGGGTVEAAVIASEGMVAWRCLRRGGVRLSEEIAGYLSGLHGVEVGVAEAEEAKREVGGAVPLPEERTLRLAAQRDGAPAEVVVSSTEVHQALRPWLEAIDEMVASLLEECPPRLREDVRGRTGLTLTGGAAQLRGLDRHLASVFRIPVETAGDPAGCVARGAGAALENLDVVKRTFLYVR